MISCGSEWVFCVTLTIACASGAAAEMFSGKANDLASSSMLHD